MPLPVSSVVWSTTEACRGCCTLSCIGSMHPSESSTSSASWRTAVWKAKHPSTWPTSVSHSPQSHLGSVSDPPADNFWTYRATDWVFCRAFSVAGPSVWNSLSAYLSLRDPAVGKDSFRKQLKTFLFAMY